MISLYELRLADPEVRPSPYCWLVRWALLHKGLPFTTVALGFSEKHNYPDPEYGLVPVLRDDGELVRGSFEILDHLQRKYPERPLAATAGERAAFDFYWEWLIAALLPALAPLTIKKVYDALDRGDQEYFRESREKRFGKPLERLADDVCLPLKVESALKSLAGPLARHRFLGGDSANQSDYLVASFLMWPRMVSARDPYETPAAVSAWMERMLDLYDGHGRRAKRAV